MKINHASLKICDTADLKQLAGVSASTFFESFSDQNSGDDMQKYLEENLNLAQLSAEMNDPACLFIMAYDNNNPVGYTKLRTSKTPAELKHRKALEIERLYVLRTHHDQKYGALLMQYCIDYATDHLFDCIWLGVWELNERAIRFYRRWDFEQFGTQLFNLGNDAQVDLLMKKEIRV